METIIAITVLLLVAVLGILNWITLFKKEKE